MPSCILTFCHLSVWYLLVIKTVPSNQKGFVMPSNLFSRPLPSHPLVDRLLSSSELQIMHLCAQGFTMEDQAAQLGLSCSVYLRRYTRLVRKLGLRPAKGCSDVALAMAWAALALLIQRRPIPLSGPLSPIQTEIARRMPYAQTQDCVARVLRRSRSSVIWHYGQTRSILDPKGSAPSTSAAVAVLAGLHYPHVPYFTERGLDREDTFYDRVMWRVIGQNSHESIATMLGIPTPIIDHIVESVWRRTEAKTQDELLGRWLGILGFDLEVFRLGLRRMNRGRMGVVLVAELAERLAEPDQQP